MNALAATALRRSYGEGPTRIEVLKDISLNVMAGEIMMIVGPSGCGKSTLLGVLSGLLKPDTGAVNVMGQDIWTSKPRHLEKLRRDHFGFVFQGFNLFASLTALQQVVFPLQHAGVAVKTAVERARQMLAEVGLSDRLNMRPSQLSGGEKQRVAIARALAKSPRLVFADEPTSALDTAAGQNVVALLRRLAKEQGTAVIAVTHDPRLLTHADRVIYIDDGRISREERITHVH